MIARPTLSLAEQLRTHGALNTVPVAQADGSLLMSAPTPAAHGPSHSGSGLDPITSLGALTLTGNLTFSAARVVNLEDNDAAALSFDTVGKTGMLLFDTTDGSEVLSTSADLEIAAARHLLWTGRADLSSSADGYLELRVDDLSQGIRFDVDSYATRLVVSEHDGTNADIQLIDGAFRPNSSSYFTKSLLSLASTTGATINNSGATGFLNIQTANVGSGTSGILYVHSGDSIGTGNSGNVPVYTGSSAAGTVGDLRFGVGGDNADLIIDGATGNTVLAATRHLLWNGRADLSSPVDGKFLLSNNDLSQGILFDVGSVNGTLRLTDESGGSPVLSIGSGSTYGALSRESMIFSSNISIITVAEGTHGLYIFTKTQTAASYGGSMNFFTGGNTNTGDYPSGSLSLSTGNTNVVGTPGKLTIYSGVAGAGHAAASDVRIGVHGNNGNLIIEGSTGNTIVAAANSLMFGGLASLHHDATDMILTTDLTAASDLLLDCGTEKTLELVEVVYDDLRMPLTAGKTGASNPPTFSQYRDDGASSVGVFAYAFADQAVAGNEEQLWFQVQLPHGWKPGTDIAPHLHWGIKTAGAANEFVQWGLEYVWVNIDGTFGTTTIITSDASSTATATTSGDTTLAINKHYLTSIPDISGAGSTISSMLLCRMFRNSSHADDDLAQDAYAFEFDFHYQIDTMGSRQELVK